MPYYLRRLEMLGVRLSQGLDKRLSLLSQKTHRPKSFYVREALERYLEDIEDYYLALEAHEEYVRSGRKAISLEDLAKDLKIDLP